MRGRRTRPGVVLTPYPLTPADVHDARLGHLISPARLAWPTMSKTHQEIYGMGQTFLFIDGIDADQASKRLMRRHVMKGKNAGKTLHRPTRPDLRAVRRQAYAKAHPNLCPENQVTAVFGNPLLTFSFPVQVTPRAIQTINDCEFTAPFYTVNTPVDSVNGSLFLEC